MTKEVCYWIGRLLKGDGLRGGFMEEIGFELIWGVGLNIESFVFDFMLDVNICFLENGLFTSI